jgi:tripeptidyl-peptidase-1
MRAIAVFLVLTALAGVVSGDNVLFTRTSAPPQWQLGKVAAPTERVEFTIALKQRNLDVLTKKFWEVSMPKSDNYQNYMSVEEILDIVAPPKGDHDHVVNWLIKHGVGEEYIVSRGDSLDVTTHVKIASKIFKTTFHYYTHLTEKTTIVRQFGAYSVPKRLANLIDMVTGLSTFPIPHLAVRNRASNDNVGIVAESLADLYSIPSLSAGSSPSTSQGVIEFQGQCFAPADLANYATSIDVKIPAVPAANIVGPNDPTQPQTESTLDIEFIASVNNEATNWFWLESGNGWLYQFGTHFFSTAEVPQVVSISYGWYEGDQCTISPDECSQLGVDSTGYVQRVNTEFQKIGLRGVSILTASGDSGANGRTDPGCTIPQLRAPFPGSSPYVTSVGATEVVNTTPLANPPPLCATAGLTCISAGTEQAVSFAVSGFASGGGFSNISIGDATPYQGDAVKAYLNSGVALPPASYFNAAGRGMPDVAAVGHNCIINQGGAIEPVGGTSCAAPIFAGVISLLNQAVVAKTGKPLGFLNPFLYQAASEHPAAFHDVVTGDNKCTEEGCSASCQGFLATKGWDPVTGLGTPNYAELLAYVQSDKF